MSIYHNEFAHCPAEWARNLMRDGHIPAGVVDERNLWDVPPADLTGYTQVHLCNGISGWPYALRLAGWPVDRPIWSCSAPCQPFSEAGKGLGFADERHLWPAVFHHVEALRPAVIVGEQVASSDGKAWLSLVSSDLEALGYAVWAVVLPVASVGAPGERHRILWLAYAHNAEWRPDTPVRNDGVRTDARRSQGPGDLEGRGEHERMADAAPVGRGESGTDGSGARCRDVTEGLTAGPVSGGPSIGMGNTDGIDTGWHGGDVACSQTQGGVGRQIDGNMRFGADVAGRIERLGDSVQPRPQGHSGDVADGGQPGRHDPQPHGPTAAAGDGAGGMADATGGGYDGSGDFGRRRSESPDCLPVTGTDASDGFWSSPDWLYCTDGKWRPVESGSRALAYGLPRSMGGIGPRLAGLATMAGADAASLKAAKAYRVGALKGYGNAINPVLVAAWIRTWMSDI